MTIFPTPLPNSFRDNPSLSGAYNLVAAYLHGSAVLSSYSKCYDILIDGDGITYKARRDDVGDIVDFDTDVGALINRLFVGGGVRVYLRTPGTYNQSTTIAPVNNCALIGQGPLTIIKAATNLGSSTSYMFDTYNGSVGRKWIQVMDVWFDCNSLAYGGIRALGVQSDTTAFTMYFRNVIYGFVTVGIHVDDFDTSGGTRQYVWANKMGPGKSNSPTRGLEIRCNDIHTWKNDITQVTDVGIYVSSRGASDKSVGTWWVLDTHVAVGNIVAGGVSPDSTAPVNIFIDTGMTSGNIQDCYIDNIRRYAIYVKPQAGFKVTELRVTDNWFNGAKMADSAGSDKATALVLDAANVHSGDIYAVKFLNNHGTSSYSRVQTTRGRWKSLIALLNGLTQGNNYVQVNGNFFKGALNLWDLSGARPDLVGDANMIQPAVNNTSQATYSGNQGLFTTLTNLLQNASLLASTVVTNVPDGWHTSGNIVGSYPGGGVWQSVHNVIGAILYQDVPVIPGLPYSASISEQITVDAAGTESARLTIAFQDEFGVSINSFNASSSPAGVQGSPSVLSNLNRTAPVDDLTTHGTGGMALNGSTLTAATGTFPSSAAVVGLTVVVAGAGSADGSVDLVTTITAWTSTTVVTLANPCLNSSGVSGAPWVLGAAGTVGGTSSGTALVAATGKFTSMVAGQQIILQGANADGTDFITTVASFTDATHVVLAVAIPVVHAANAWTIPTLIWGHGDAVSARVSLRATGTAPLTTQWSDARFCQAATTAGQSGANTTWVIPHKLGAAPSYVQLTPANSIAAANVGYVSAVDSTNITVTTPSCTGPSWYWRALL